MDSQKTYCLVCKKDTENKNPKVFKTDGRLLLRSACSECNNKKSRFRNDLDYYQVFEKELL